MKKYNKNTISVGWNFDNSYALLPENLMSRINPEIVKKPELVILNKKLGDFLNLNFQNLNKNNLAKMFSGNNLPNGSECIAQAYAGHQFGHFTMLGDGRAILLGEHINNLNNRYDIQLKGSGKTPYSRNGDGKAALGPMLREYIISEAMFGLGIPTTRSLAVVSTGEKILREKNHEGAILTRVASSHIRIGTFQYLAMINDYETMEVLIKYTLKRHYPDLPLDNNLSVNLLRGLMDRQISLIINWMRVGFVFGVMNTDNMTLSGETIDYGPCAFMDRYDPNTVFSSIDHRGRYSFSNQEIICHWNLSRFAESLIPLLHKNEKMALDIGREIIDEFSDKFQEKWIKMMKSKFGFIGNNSEDKVLIKKFLRWMEINKADYTNTFIVLMKNKEEHQGIYKNESFKEIYNKWLLRINKNKLPKEISVNLMKANNPKIIPRNHIVEEALTNAIKNNYKQLYQLLDLIEDPYHSSKIVNPYYLEPNDINLSKNYKTFCGT